MSDSDKNGIQLPSDHVVLITGGGTGIGEAIARAFDRAGATVCISGRRQAPLKATAEAMSDRTRCYQFDVDDLDAIPSVINQIEVDCGTITTLVNNAGKHQKKPTLEVEDEEFLGVVTTNLRATFALTREVAKRLIAAERGGDIQFISSMSAFFGLPMVAAYTASKTAVTGLARQLTSEWASLGIRVNAIAPGFIETEMSRTVFDADPARREKVIQRTPAGRLGSPQDVAGLSLFLASDQASFITGTTIPVDGGAAIGF